VDQKRWYDNFVISMAPIGPMVVPRLPEIVKMPLPGVKDWELEVASDDEGKRVAWRSHGLGAKERASVGATTGVFVGAAAAKRELPGDTIHWCRARQKADGDWSAWSGWHQAFRTAR
jgi:hypothetical protein